MDPSNRGTAADRSGSTDLRASAGLAERPGAEAIFVGFTNALRSAGLEVGYDRAAVFLEAVQRLGADDREHVYWAGKVTLCRDVDEYAVYDKVFDHWFAAEHEQPGTRAEPPLEVSQPDVLGEDGPGEEGDDLEVPLLASAEELLRHRDVAGLSADERRRLARLFEQLTLVPPIRRSRRRDPYRRGDIDRARTVRDQLHRAGEPGPLRYRRPRARPRRIVMLIDISGSMDAYADSLLRLAHRVVHAAPHTTEVFTLGTRLTRVTTALRIKDPEQALKTAGESVPDWSGGTRLGEVLRAFTDRWGQRGLARGAVIVIASDGWERGDSALLGEQIHRLQRLARAVIWSNPHRGKEGYAPVQSGIVAALPYLDELVAGHSLAAFTELLELISDA